MAATLTYGKWPWCCSDNSLKVVTASETSFESKTLAAFALRQSRSQSYYCPMRDYDIMKTTFTCNTNILECWQLTKLMKELIMRGHTIYNIWHGRHQNKYLQFPSEKANLLIVGEILWGTQIAWILALPAFKLLWKDWEREQIVVGCKKLWLPF